MQLIRIGNKKNAAKEIKTKTIFIPTVPETYNEHSIRSQTKFRVWFILTE